MGESSQALPSGLAVPGAGPDLVGEVDPQRVGYDLNVRAVMIGRMQRVRDHFAISTELVDVLDGSLLWGEQYARKPSDILSLQDEISSDIAKQLKLKLTSGVTRRLARPRTRNRSP